MSRSGRVAAIVLAAGRATRFGSTKQLALVGGRPLIRVSVGSILASWIDDVVVVLGHDADRVRSALAGLPVRTLVNERFAEGMGTSVAAGIASLGDDVGCALVVLGDQPVPSGIVERLVERWRSGDAGIVTPAYRGSRGNPVLFDSTLFPELALLHGERGARALVDASSERTAIIDFVDVPAPPDVDRTADLNALRSSLEPASGRIRQSDRPRLL